MVRGLDDWHAIESIVLSSNRVGRTRLSPVPSIPINAQLPIDSMPNAYSHALVLANYEALGFLDSSGYSYKYSTSRSPGKQHKLSSRDVPAASERTSKSISNNIPRADKDTPRHSLDSNMPSRTPSPLIDFGFQALTRQRSVDTVKVTDTATPPSTYHLRNESDTTTVRSFRSGSTGSLPAPSIITQIHAPLRPASPSQPAGNEPSFTPSPASTPRRKSSSSPTSQYESRSTSSPSFNLASSLKSRKSRLVILEEDSAEDQRTYDVVAPCPVRSSATRPIAEPSLDIDSLDNFTGTTVGSGRTSRENYRPSLSMTSTTTNRMYLDFTHSDPPTPTRSLQIPAIAVPPPRSISPASLTTVSESIDDNDTELYFGSADESSEEEYTDDEDPTSSSSPTSLEDSLDTIAPWGQPRLSPNLFRNPENFAATRSTRESRSSQSSIRGLSPDDAVPPPIARVRRVDFDMPSETHPPTRRPLNISRCLTALRPSFPSVKRTFSLGTTAPAAQPRNSASSLSVRKSSKPAPKDLISGSVPYDQAVQATAPIETDDAAALLPPPSKALQESLLLRGHPGKMKRFGLEAQRQGVRSEVKMKEKDEWAGVGMASPAVEVKAREGFLVPSSREVQARLRKRPGRVIGRGNGVVGPGAGAGSGVRGERERGKEKGLMSVPYARAVQAQMPVMMGEKVEGMEGW